MNENPYKSTEQFKPEIRLATPHDWKFFEKLKFESFEGSQAEFFGITPENKRERIEEEKSLGEAGWAKRLSGGDSFGVIIMVNNAPIGIGLVKRREDKGGWYMYSGYVKPEFQNQKLGQKMFALRLKEISNRSGIKVTMGVKAHNDVSIHIAEEFGFRKILEKENSPGFDMVLEDVNNDEVMQKINETLNAR